MGRILAIDYGQTRIGLALSDPLQIIAQPFKTIDNRGITNLIDQLKTIIKEQDVEVVVVGKPVSMSGDTSAQTEIVMAFVDKLIAEVNLPVLTIDERLSSVEAKRRLQQKGIKTGHNKGKIDAMSAAIILETYLMEH